MTEIKGNKLEGYLWYSDQDKSTVYNGTKECFEFDDNDNPFVIEGQLYDTEEKKSYSIKYVDGGYLKKEYPKDFKGKDLSGCEITNKYYQSNRMDGKVLQFMEIWRPVPDSLCEESDSGSNGMSVLQPAELVFVGFKK